MKLLKALLVAGKTWLIWKKAQLDVLLLKRKLNKSIAKLEKVSG